MPELLQPWVKQLSLMQQSVLLAAIRAPDGIRKEHAVKVLMRWYIRCVLISAFDRKALTDPFSLGGGSFTGPFTIEHAQAENLKVHDWYSTDSKPWSIFNEMRNVYLRHVDELPHHFQLHFMHAAEIVGYKHDTVSISEWWLHFYRMIVNDAHLFPETREQMDKRLSDTETEWRAREEVIAK